MHNPSNLPAFQNGALLEVIKEVIKNLHIGIQGTMKLLPIQLQFARLAADAGPAVSPCTHLRPDRPVGSRLGVCL